MIQWHVQAVERFQERFGLSDYQMLMLSFVKGLVVGTIIRGVM